MVAMSRCPRKQALANATKLVALGVVCRRESSSGGRRRRAGFEPERRRRQVNNPMAYRCAGLFASVSLSALWRFAEERPARGAGASAFGVTRPRCAMVTTRAAARGEQSDGGAARGCVRQAERDGTAALLFAASVTVG